jgi:hypothetical protein
MAHPIRMELWFPTPAQIKLKVFKLNILFLIFKTTRDYKIIKKKGI